MRLKRGGNWEYLFLFLVGASWDAIISLDTIFTAHFLVAAVYVTSVATAMLPYVMLDRIQEQKKINWGKAWALAAGSGFGASLMTYITGRFY